MAITTLVIIAQLCQARYLYIAQHYAPFVPMRIKTTNSQPKETLLIPPSAEAARHSDFDSSGTSSVLDNYANFILTDTITFTPSSNSNSSSFPVLFSNSLLLHFAQPPSPLQPPLVALVFLPRQSRVFLSTPLLPACHRVHPIRIVALLTPGAPGSCPSQAAAVRVFCLRPFIQIITRPCIPKPWTRHLRHLHDYSPFRCATTR